MTKIRWGRTLPLFVLLTVAVSGGLVVSAAEAQDGVSSKVRRQIRVMEKILDEVLVDSPNLLVGSREVTHGVYLDEFGVLFTFEASLSTGNSWYRFGEGNWKFESRDGQIVIYQQDKDDADDNADDDGDDAQDEDDGPVVFDRHGDWRKKAEQDKSELYARGKDELIEVLMDYGETLSGLRDDQWVAVAAFLDDSYLLDNRISYLVLKARLRDLRSYGSGQLSEKAMKSRVVQEEY